MKKRQRKKFASIDASGVKEIAEMQRYIDKLEEIIWFLFRFSMGKDGVQSVLNTLDDDSATAMAFEGLYDFIKEHKEEKK